MEKTTTSKNYKMTQKQAIALVNEQISDYRTQLEAITLLPDDAEPHPVMVEGETEKGYYVQLMVDPRIPARIMLQFDYPMYAVLGEDAPQEMWNRLGLVFGIATVTSVDL